MTKRKYNVKLDSNMCKACGICIEFCPTGVLGPDIEGKAVIINMDDCTGCLFCEKHCPDFCLEVEAREDE